MAKDDKITQEEIGAGLDVGTMNFVAARRVGGKVKTTRLRNAFLDLPPEHKRMLKLSKTSFMEYGDRLLVIGDEAISTANLFNKEARRPMSAGTISAGEIDAQGVMSVIVKHLLGGPHASGEQCCFSVPAPAVDVPEFDTTYHKAVLDKILTELGYTPQPVNEALAIVYSECAAENFSGLALSYGSGMTNVCLAHNALSALEFSLARGGDWVDRGAARAVGITAAKVCTIKESGVTITSPRSREEEAVALYLQALIDYSIDGIIAHFSKVRKEILVPKPIPIVVSGGTSLADGFVKKFQERFELHRGKFPIEISEIRPAKDPMTAVASGLLLFAQMD